MIFALFHLIVFALHLFFPMHLHASNEAPAKLTASYASQAYFDFEEVKVTISNSNPWLTVNILFSKASPTLNGAFKGTFRIGFDSNIEQGYFHAMRLNNSFRIPDSLADEGNIGEFYLAQHTAQNGNFRKLFNSLAVDEQIKLYGACSYVVSNAQDLLKKASQRARSENISTFLLRDKHINDVKKFAKMCRDISSRVYVKDLQRHLSILGFNPGIIDGKWGKNSEGALNRYSNSIGVDANDTSLAELFFDLRFRLGGEAPSLLEASNATQYFDQNSKISSKRRSDKNTSQQVSRSLIIGGTQDEEYRNAVFGLRVSKSVDVLLLKTNLRELCFNISKLNNRVDADLFIAMLALYDRQGVYSIKKLIHFQHQRLTT